MTNQIYDLETIEAVRFHAKKTLYTIASGTGKSMLQKYLLNQAYDKTWMDTESIFKMNDEPKSNYKFSQIGRAHV